MQNNYYPHAVNSSLAGQFAAPQTSQYGYAQKPPAHSGFAGGSHAEPAGANVAFGLPPGVQPGLNWSSLRLALGTTGLAPEPPLLQELGFNFTHVRTKGITVLNPFRPVDQHIMDDTDLAGPLIFIFAFGAFMLLAGKLQFGYIYGLSALGVAGMYALLNLMSDHGVSAGQTASVLGYCLLPMVILSVATSLLGGGGLLGTALAATSVCWCTFAASSMFTAVLRMTHQKALVAYPIMLFYSLLALLAVF